MLKRECVMAAASALLMVAGTAEGALVHVTWVGTVQSTPFVGVVDIGDAIIGSWTYDSAAFGVAGGIQAFYYTHHDLSFSVRGLSGTFSDQVISVINRAPGDGENDQIDSRPNASGSPTYNGDLFSGFSPLSIQVSFTDSTGTVFSDLSLPTVLDPASFDFKNGSCCRATQYMTFSIPGTGRQDIGFVIDTFSAAQLVPEPNSLALALIGLAGAGFAACGCLRAAISSVGNSVDRNSRFPVLDVH